MYPELKSTKPFTQQIHLLHQLTKNKERYANLSDYFVWLSTTNRTGQLNLDCGTFITVP